MAICLNANKDEQIELELPNGEIIVILIFGKNGRSVNNINIAITAPSTVSVVRRPRKNKEDNSNKMKRIGELFGAVNKPE